MRRWFSMSSGQNDQFAREALGKFETLNGSFIPIQGKGAVRNKTRSHPQSDEIDDQIEVVELHYWRDRPLLPGNPSSQSLTSVGRFVDKQPTLILHPCSQRFSARRFRRIDGVRGNQRVSVLETVGDFQSF